MTLVGPFLVNIHLKAKKPIMATTTIAMPQNANVLRQQVKNALLYKSAYYIGFWRDLLEHQCVIYEFAYGLDFDAELVVLVEFE